LIVLQEFKCHSLILSSASPFFKKLLEGVHFKGPKMGRDEPIALENIEPEVFESAMK
jgi:BTB/POZ domain